MATTRQVVLRTLKERGQATIAELAVALDLSPVTVRHHLTSLQADGLIESEEVRGNVGRPHLLYRLTDTGREMFPRKYLRLTDRLLEELKATLPSDAVSQLFTSMAASIAADTARQLAGLPLEKRLTALVDILGEEGFMAQWEKAGAEYRLTEYNCPYYYVSQRHPEVCAIDLKVMQTVLDSPVHKSTCMLDGDTCCTFTIRPVIAAVREAPSGDLPK